MSKWIPINEGVPEPGQYVLLSFSNREYVAEGCYRENNEGGEFCDICMVPYTCIDMFVNAWQPLPAPYREDEDE